MGFVLSGVLVALLSSLVVVDAQQNAGAIAKRVLTALGCTSFCGCGYALVCDGSNVTELHFSTFSTSASILTEIGLLTDLEELNLSNADEGAELRLTGTVPTELKALTKLTFLDLSGNRNLVGDFSTFLPLTSLTQLTVGKSKLRGTLDGIERLPHLVELSVDESSMNGTLPTELGLLTDIQWLFVDGSRFVGTLPTQLSNLTKLKRFWCSNSAFSGSIPKLSSSLERGGCVLQDDDVLPIGCLDCSTLHASNDKCVCDAAPLSCPTPVTLAKVTVTTTVRIGTVPVTPGVASTSSSSVAVGRITSSPPDTPTITPGVASTSSSSVTLGSITSLPPDTPTITPGVASTSSSSVTLGSLTASPPDAGMIAGVVAGVVCCLLLSAAVAVVVWWRKKSLSHESAKASAPTPSTPKSEYASVLAHLN
jgi:hypothetical protein